MNTQAPSGNKDGNGAKYDTFWPYFWSNVIKSISMVVLHAIPNPVWSNKGEDRPTAYNAGAQRDVVCTWRSRRFDNGFWLIQWCRTRKFWLPVSQLWRTIRKTRFKIIRLYAPIEGIKHFCRWSVGHHMGCKMTGIIVLVGTDHISKALGQMLFEILAKN